jgi:hypothetical protein
VGCKDELNADLVFILPDKNGVGSPASALGAGRKENREKRRNTLTLGASCDKIFSIIWLCRTQPWVNQITENGDMNHGKNQDS